MEGTLLHHSAPMQHVKFRVPTILTTPKIGGVPHHALERSIPLAPTHGLNRSVGRLVLKFGLPEKNVCVRIEALYPMFHLDGV